MFRGMWVDSRSALKGLGATARCCDFATGAVNSSGQAYDASGYCTFPESQGGAPGATCENQFIAGFSNTTLMLAGGLLLLIFVLGAKK